MKKTTVKKKVSAKTGRKPNSQSKATPAVKSKARRAAATKVAAPVPKQTTVEIKPAKGRPMLTWVGKKPLRNVTAYPAQLIETFDARQKTAKAERWQDWPKHLPQAGLLFHGDNKDVLAYMLANGFRERIKLIYIDPPFDSGADYVRKVELRGAASGKVVGEGYGLGEQLQYADIWANDNYLQFMYERLLLLRELLRQDGSLYLHCDWHKAHQLRFLLEEVFSAENFRNEIVWAYPGREMHIEHKYNAKHDSLLFVAKSDQARINMAAVAMEYDKETRLKGLRRKLHKDTDGREWVWETRGQAAGQEPYKRYLDEIIEEGHALNDVWEDIQFLRGNDPERTGFPTQKPEGLVERLVLASSDAGDIVLDCFLGSGTTATVAQKLGRRWIGADINKGAIQTTALRLQGVIQEQASAADGAAQTLPGMDREGPESPTQLGVAFYRVNDYDLQIQHNEAFNLAVEHLGMTRSKTDAFFDGTLGKRLVKIVPFTHPVSPLDLEEVKRELGNRPEEERDIVVVGLGRELAVAPWLDDWNKLRKQGSIPNKIDVIELRSDPKYGGFFTHEPAKAKITFRRAGNAVEVEIEDFISPTILERLRLQNKDNPLFQPQIKDWRSMVDSVMIDPAYDGKVFNIGVADVPERKDDLVEGKYSVEAAKGATIAVKITDMLGEEVLVVREI
jgi:DNA modification methylase